MSYGNGSRPNLFAWMHSGYASSNVQISVDVYPEGSQTARGTVSATDGVTAVVAARGWTEGPMLAMRWTSTSSGWTTAVINECSRLSGTDRATLADAHAIIDSMRTEAIHNDLRFRLVFALTTNDWDSG